MINQMNKVTIAALFILCAGIFTSVSITALSHVLLIISGSYFTFLYLKKDNKNFSPSAYALVFLVLSIFASVLFNLDTLENPLKNIAKAKYFIIPLLSVSALQYFLKSYPIDERPKVYKVLLNTFIIATSIATVSGLIGLYSGFNPIKFKNACHHSRACGLYGMYMTYGYGIGFFLTLNLGAILFKNKLTKLINPNLLYLSFLINLSGLYFSFARGAWLGFFGSIPFFFLFKNKKIFISLILVGIIGAGSAFTFSKKIRDTFTKRGHSNAQRLAFYETAYMAFKEKPLFGLGYRNFEANVKEIKKRYDIAYPEFGGHAHNNFLEHLASTGIIGFFALIIFCLAWLYEAKSLPIVFAFIINFILSGQVQYTFGDGENLFLIMLIWTMTSTFTNIRKRNESCPAS